MSPSNDQSCGSCEFFYDSSCATQRIRSWSVAFSQLAGWRCLPSCPRIQVNWGEASRSMHPTPVFRWSCRSGSSKIIQRKTSGRPMNLPGSACCGVPNNRNDCDTVIPHLRLRGPRRLGRRSCPFQVAYWNRSKPMLPWEDERHQLYTSCFGVKTTVRLSVRGIWVCPNMGHPRCLLAK